MSPEQVRELRHELRTPVNHLIGYAELLLEEEGLAGAHVAQLEAIRAVARQVLELVPGIIGVDGTPDESAAHLRAHVSELEASTSALRAAPGVLPIADLERLTAAAVRLGELARKLATGTVASASQPGVAEPPRQGRLETVLVVDDDATNRDVLGRRLQRLGYGVIDARDGVEALERMAAGGIDLVLLDVMMPRLDGFAVLERHRADPAIRNIPIIMISALDDMASVVRCIEAGAEDYLTKPFDPVLLKARLGACMEKKRLRDNERALLARVEAQAEELRDWNRRLEQRVADQVQEVERLSLMRRFLPPQLADVITSGGIDLLKSHRREVTVLFCDLRGFTSFAERSEPEDVMAVLADLHNAVGPLVFEQGGTLAQFLGDGMMVLFNDPVPCDEPARRAVTLALGMRDRAATLSETWKRRGHDLRLGVGIATGYATCGQVGFEGRHEYAAIGTVTNLAARLCGEAKGGQILISQRVVTMLDGAVHAEHAGDIEFKGIARPVPTYVVQRLAE
jgi:class 3 adenylate cyclase